MPLSRIHKYVAQDQLPVDLGGSWTYSHELWIQNRVVSMHDLQYTQTLTLYYAFEFHFSFGLITLHTLEMSGFFLKFFFYSYIGIINICASII